ncbi:Gfo/Idh/MocA family oxidoreductase [Vagococcus sp. BWB3-3]|uniref:Gfo/Idh/MocA family oxidoreductase n=1 Tax=Vagococcus allomyrinae TaxID=2794353 RepID=A0A940P4I7_9ENTE|nr:Gfo/Idh/MocA family oxidoreductase [Vagococcus allomyrinae]MBP1039586.1 Gfo/Idh/MocA family oxidoreductase [Vagococcus allomyrinae]
MRKFKAGIIGCGNIFEMHAKALAKLELVDLVAVCDSDQQRVRLAGQHYDCQDFTDYRRMFKEATLDVLHICLPHYLHEEVTVAAAKAGIHVLTEKPMAITVESAERMLMAAREAQIELGVIFQNRYNSGAMTLKSLIQEGALGKVLSGKCQVTWSRDETYYSQSDWKGTWEKEGGGVVIDQAIHTLDLINWLTGGQPKLIDATIGNRFHDTIEVEDFAEGIIQYQEGYTLSFFANNYYSFDAPVCIEIHTELAVATITGARLEIVYFDGRPTLVKDIPAEDYLENGIASKTYWGTGHITQIDEFYQHLNGTADFLVSGIEALKTQKIVAGIYQSAKLNKPVWMI